MSKSNTFENDLLNLIFKGVSIDGIARNDISPNTDLYLSLHTGDPGEEGDQETNEADYTGYARMAIKRDSEGWNVVADTASLVNNVEFPECTGGSNTITHFAVGTNSTGAGKILYYGTATPNISVAEGVIPRLKKESTIKEN